MFSHQKVLQNGAKHSPPTCLEGGPSGIFGGSSCEAFFFAFNPKFSPSKTPPETKPSFWQRFWTMRIRMVIIIFLWEHGICPAETTLGPVVRSTLLRLGAKHFPPTCLQGGPSGIFGGSSCDTFFSPSTQSFPRQKPLQKQNLLCIKGFGL